MPLSPGRTVRNANLYSRYYNMVGIFHKELPWQFQGKGDTSEPACDVAYPGQLGPYGYPYIAQRISDLVVVEESEKGG